MSRTTDEDPASIKLLIGCAVAALFFMIGGLLVLFLFGAYLLAAVLAVAVLLAAAFLIVYILRGIDWALESVGLESVSRALGLKRPWDKRVLIPYTPRKWPRFRWSLTETGGSEWPIRRELTLAVTNTGTVAAYDLRIDVDRYQSHFAFEELSPGATLTMEIARPSDDYVLKGSVWLYWRLAPEGEEDFLELEYLGDLEG
ncbi:MAG: hypothetical protein KDC39_11970 [Actinobacteria bacterium]|nr:hypothetical protein [Actinomycetota bacterium]